MPAHYVNAGLVPTPKLIAGHVHEIYAYLDLTNEPRCLRYVAAVPDSWSMLFSWSVLVCRFKRYERVGSVSVSVTT